MAGDGAGCWGRPSAFIPSPGGGLRRPPLPPGKPLIEYPGAGRTAGQPHRPRRSLLSRYCHFRPGGVLEFSHCALGHAPADVDGWKLEIIESGSCHCRSGINYAIHLAR